MRPPRSTRSHGGDFPSDFTTREEPLRSGCLYGRESFIFALEDRKMLRDPHDVEDLDDEGLDVAQIQLRFPRRRNVVRHDDQANTARIDNLHVVEVEDEMLNALIDPRADRLLEGILEGIRDVEVQAPIVERNDTGLVLTEDSH